MDAVVDVFVVAFNIFIIDALKATPNSSFVSVESAGVDNGISTKIVIINIKIVVDVVVVVVVIFIVGLFNQTLDRFPHHESEFLK